MDRAGVRIKRLGEVVEVLQGPLDWRRGVGGRRVRARSRLRRAAAAGSAAAPPLHRWRPRADPELAGRLADIVSINFDNSGRPARGIERRQLGAGETAEAGVGPGWRGAAVRRRRVEIGAYFVAVDDEPGPMIAPMAARVRRHRGGIRVHPHALLGTVDSICDTLQERRERFGFSYVTIAQRNMDEFAPVVARLAGT